MILILASIADSEAPAFAGEFGGSACVLTCNDVVRGPTRILHPSFDDSTVTAAGRSLAVRDISAVLNLLPAVIPNELTLYPAAERTYQAAEIRALLTYFLSSLKCPVINRATPLHLNGPVQNPVAWLAAANRAGIPVSLPQSDSAAPPVEVLSVGGRLVQSSGTEADEHTLQLVDRYDLEYLKALYRDSGRQLQLIGADSYPDIRNPQARAALRAHLLEAAA